MNRSLTDLENQPISHQAAQLWKKCLIKQEWERQGTGGNVIGINQEQLNLLKKTYRTKGLEYMKITPPTRTCFGLCQHRYVLNKKIPYQLVQELYFVCINNSNTDTPRFAFYRLRTANGSGFYTYWPEESEEYWQDIHVFYKPNPLTD